MSLPPSSALASAAVAGQALALVLLNLAGTLPVAPQAQAEAMTAARRGGSILAPRLRAISDVAAMTAALILAVQMLARACEPSDAAAGLYVAAGAAPGCAPVSASPILTREYALSRAVCAGFEAACLGEAFLCEARTTFGDRQAASAARDRIIVAHDAALDRISAVLGQGAAFVLGTAAGQTCAHLVDISGSLQPIVQAEAGRSMPSTGLAWSLYGDPVRSAELVARNRCGTPLFMPATFEALAPKS